MSNSPKERHDVRADRGKRNGQFITRKRKAWFDNIQATKKARYREESTQVKFDQPAKNRIVDLKNLAERLWCPSCEVPLSLKFIEKEYRNGLVSVLTIRWHACQKPYEIETSRRSINSSTARERYDLNYKVAAAIIDGGSGTSQLNSMLSAMNIPVLTPHFLKRYENEIGPAFEEVATSSCRDAIMKERELTLQAEYMQNLEFCRMAAVSDFNHHGYIHRIAK